MDYRPRHPQPFTFAQALQLEIPIITEEISRLENSLQHLGRTQNELNKHLTGSSEEDRDLLDAMKENDEVVASQKERISMLKMALEEKGVNTSSGHYGLTDVNVAGPTATSQDGGVAQTSSDSRADTVLADGGVYL